MRSDVRLFPDPPIPGGDLNNGAIAQLGEHLLCKQGVVGSIPSSSTKIQTQAFVFAFGFYPIGCLFFNNLEEVK